MSNRLAFTPKDRLRLDSADALRLLEFALPQQLVEDHKSRMLSSGSSALRTLWLISSAICLMRPLLWAGRMFPRISILASIGQAAIVLGIIGLGKIVDMYADQNLIISVLACVPIGAFVVTLSLRTVGVWTSVRLDSDFTAHIIGMGLIQVPEHLRERAHAAMKIPGVRLEADVIYDDPILYAVVGWLWWMVRVPIGAWDTGTILDEL